MRFLFCWAIFVCFMQVAVGQEVAAEAPDGFISSFPSLAKIMIYMVSLQIILRGAAEALTRIAVTTETKTDNKIASLLGQAAWVMGSMLGKFGYSVPKLVVKEEAKKLNEEKK